MKWVTKSGHTLDICEMTDTHLTNAIRLFCRKAHILRANCLRYLEMESLDALCFASSCSGEMASYYADQESSIATERAITLAQYPGLIPYQVDYMVQELHNRKVAIPIEWYNGAKYGRIDKDGYLTDTPYFKDLT
jgi:hypothetical protein